MSPSHPEIGCFVRMKTLILFATGVPVPVFSQNQTVAVLTFTQPITPLFEVRQAVRIARADERIAMAKAGVPVSKNARNTELEETYFKLLLPTTSRCVRGQHRELARAARSMPEPPSSRRARSHRSHRSWRPGRCAKTRPGQAGV